MLTRREWLQTAAMFSAALVSSSPDHSELMKTLEVPMLFVFGTRTGGVPEGFTDAMPPHGQAISISEAGRLACLENVDEFNEAVRTFWKSVPA